MHEIALFALLCVTATKKLRLTKKELLISIVIMISEVLLAGAILSKNQ